MSNPTEPTARRRCRYCAFEGRTYWTLDAPNDPGHGMFLAYSASDAERILGEYRTFRANFNPAGGDAVFIPSP